MKKKNSLVITGITSLFLIFSVLCLVILSILSLGTSRSDLAMSKQTMVQTANYYEACNSASEICLNIEDNLWNFYHNSANSDEYYQKIASISYKNLTWDALNHMLSLKIPFSKTQALLITLEILYPLSDDDVCLNICTWKTIATGTWNPDNIQPIYQGE